MIPLQVAVITTAYYALSHADVMVTRWLEPRPDDAKWGWPSTKGEPSTRIASLYIAPGETKETGHPQRAIGPDVASRFGVPLFGSIKEALRLGGPELAVDAVLLIGEHGDYPLNELGQKIYPRFEFWQEIIAVIHASGRSIPVFCDKHLSYDNAWALQMAHDSRNLKIPLMAGSSLPHCPLSPRVEWPGGTVMREGITLFYGGVEAYGFHSLEVGQSVFERRPGGESGIRRVTVLKGETLRRWVEGRPETLRLLKAALAVPGRPEEASSPRKFRKLTVGEALTDGMAFQVEHADGFSATHFLLEGHWPEFVVGVTDQTGTCQAARVDGGDATDFYGHFAALNASIQQWFLGAPPAAPLERTLLTTLTINSLMAAAMHPNRPVETPHLLLPYGA